MNIPKATYNRFARQFKKTKSEDFPGVVIELQHAQRHASTYSNMERRKSLKEKDGSDEEAHADAKEYDVHTVEGLRAEIDADMTAFGHDSVYDRMY